MKTDIFGNEVTLVNQKTCDNWNEMQLGLLAHSSVTPKFLNLVLTAEPEFALGHALKGIFFLMLGRRELVQTAQDSLRDAKIALSKVSITKREQQFVDALGFWLQHNPVKSRDCMEDILRKFPRDALAMKISHAISFILGDVNTMFNSIARLTPSYDPSHPAYGYFKGCQAFCFEETGDYDLAKISGITAMQHASDDAWGLHAVAHVYDMTANAKDGINWLAKQESAWSHCNNFKYHVWWHKALMHLDLGQIDQVFDLYDTEIRKDKTDDYRDISNATSLLSRLELEGYDVGNRWEELADFSENRTADGCLIFADLHYMMALVGDDRESAVKQMLYRMKSDVNAPKCTTIQNSGLSAAVGLEAFGEADYKVAFLNLSKARKNMQLAGGSHAQRDIFERLTIDAGIRSGFLNEAREILDERKKKRGGNEDQYAAARFEIISTQMNMDSSITMRT